MGNLKLVQLIKDLENYVSLGKLSKSLPLRPSQCFRWEFVLGQEEETGESPTFCFCVAPNSEADGTSLRLML